MLVDCVNNPCSVTIDFSLSIPPLERLREMLHSLQLHAHATLPKEEPYM